MLVQGAENKVASTISAAIVDASGSLCRLNRCERRALEHAGRMFIVNCGDAKVSTKNPTCVVFGGAGLDELYVTSSRQEMSLEKLEHALHSGRVYRVIPGATGIPDRQFNDS